MEQHVGLMLLLWESMGSIPVWGWMCFSLIIFMIDFLKNGSNHDSVTDKLFLSPTWNHFYYMETEIWKKLSNCTVCSPSVSWSWNNSYLDNGLKLKWNIKWSCTFIPWSALNYGRWFVFKKIMETIEEDIMIKAGYFSVQNYSTAEYIRSEIDWFHCLWCIHLHTVTLFYVRQSKYHYIVIYHYHFKFLWNVYFQHHVLTMCFCVTPSPSVSPILAVHPPLCWTMRLLLQVQGLWRLVSGTFCPLAACQPCAASV